MQQVLFHNSGRWPTIHRTCFALLALVAAVTVMAQESQARDEVAAQTHFKAAVAAYDSGDYPEAVALLVPLSALFPRNFEVRELLGLAYAGEAKVEEAVAQMKTAADLVPSSAPAHSNLAASLVHLGRLQEAEAEYRKAISLDRGDYNAHRNLAGIYLRSNRIPDALPLLLEARRLQPRSYENGYDLALAYLLSGDSSSARSTVNDLARQKDTGELHTLLGRIDEKEGKYLEAVNEFAAAAHMDPSEDNLFIWASELLLHRTYVPAIDLFRQGNRRYPNSARLLIGLGMALYARGEYEESVRTLLSALDLNPADPRCYVFLSKAYLSSPQQAEDVIARFKRYAALEPTNALAQYYYALALWKGRRLESQEVEYGAVEALLKKAISLNASLADAHLQLGILYTDQHAFERSLPEYKRALQLNPELPDVHFRLGRYYLHAGDKEKADAEFAIFKKLQAQHQDQEDRERAEVQQFVVSGGSSASAQP